MGGHMTVKMEEVDRIIIHTLRSVGCNIDGDVESLSQFPTELIIEGTATCLMTINHDVKYPTKLPPGMSARFRVGTSLADAVRDLGYRGDIGYQTFLYSSEADIRKVFIFLVEKLPKSTADSTEEPLGSAALLQRGIAAEITRQLSLPWLPPAIRGSSVCMRGSPPKWHREGCRNISNFHSCPVQAPTGLGNLTNKVPKEYWNYYNMDLLLAARQVRQSHDLPPSLLDVNTHSFVLQQEWETEWNQQGLASRLSKQEYKNRKKEKLQKKISEQIKQGVQKSEASTTQGSQDLLQMLANMQEKVGPGAGSKVKGSRFTHTEKLQFSKDEEAAAVQLGLGEGAKQDTEEELKQKREEEVASLTDTLKELMSQTESLDIECKKLAASKQQVEEQCHVRGTQNTEKEESYKVKKRTIDLIPDAGDNINKLQSVVDTSAQRIVSLANQWEKHRTPLIDKYRELKQLNETMSSEADKKLAEIHELRNKMKDAASQARSKDDMYKQLVSEYERMKKDVNRSAYTRRIMEIVTNIRKQKEDIDRILVDTRSIQKEINQLTGKLDRTFTVTDELIFRDAKKDDAVRKSYKYLAALHENCEMLIRTVEETGITMREIRDLEEQLEQEGNKKVLTNLEKISQDLAEMQKENATLISKIKKK